MPYFNHTLIFPILVPIATRYPLPNVQFEIQDVRDTWRWGVDKFDVVHARLIAMTVSRLILRFVLGAHLTLRHHR